MKILVLGAGATGGYYGARLAQAGRDVTFLVRPGRAQTLRERGLRLVTPAGEEQLTPQLISAGELRDTGQTYDLALVSTKATALQAGLDDLAPGIGPETTIVPFLNGMAHLEVLQERFPQATVLGGVVKIVAQLTGDGDIRQFTGLSGMEIGALAPEDIDRRDAAAAALSDVHGYDFSVEADILGAMWAKWTFIASLSAVCCLMRGTVGDVVAQPGGAELGRRILHEAAGVAAASGHPLARADFERVEGTVTKTGSSMTSSMFRDLSAGAGTEVEQILGDLTRRGRFTGVRTPLLDLAAMTLRVHEHQRG